MANNSALYGVIGALGVVVVGGGAYIAKQHGAFDPATTTAAVTAPAPAPAPPGRPSGPQAAGRGHAPARSTAAASPMPRADSSTGEQLRQLVLDARHAITRGDFSSADRALDQAERIDPRSSDVIAARRDLRDAQQQRAARGPARRELVADARAAIAATRIRCCRPAARPGGEDGFTRQRRAAGPRRTQRRPTAGRPGDNRRIDALVAQARTAIGRHDYCNGRSPARSGREHRRARPRRAAGAGRAQRRDTARPRAGPAVGRSPSLMSFSPSESSRAKKRKRERNERNRGGGSRRSAASPWSPSARAR